MSRHLGWRPVAVSPLVGAAIWMVVTRPAWSVVAAYGGREVYRETVARTELASRNSTVTIPADATDAFEQAGFQ
jgi:hypothetical protein